MRNILNFLFLYLFFSPASVVADDMIDLASDGNICVPWLSEVLLKGRVEVARIYGPPNYGETPKVDEEFYIHRLYPLDSSYCFVVAGSGEEMAQDLKSVTVIQLRYLGDTVALKAKIESGLCYLVEGQIIPSLGEPLNLEAAYLDVKKIKRCS